MNAKADAQSHKKSKKTGENFRSLFHWKIVIRRKCLQKQKSYSKGKNTSNSRLQLVWESFIITVFVTFLNYL